MQHNNPSNKNTLALALTMATAILFGSQALLPEPESQANGFQPTAAADLDQAAPAAQSRNRTPATDTTVMESDTRPAHHTTRSAHIAQERSLPQPAALRKTVLTEEYGGPSIEEKMAEAYYALEADYWQEVFDDQWTADFETELLDALEQRAVSDTTLDLVQCHSSICLVEFFHDTLKARNMMLHHLGAIRPHFGGFMVKTADGGPDIRTLVYFARPGQTLPLPFNLLTSV